MRPSNHRAGLVVHLRWITWFRVSALHRSDVREAYGKRGRARAWAVWFPTSTMVRDVCFRLETTPNSSAFQKLMITGKLEQKPLRVVPMWARGRFSQKWRRRPKTLPFAAQWRCRAGRSTQNLAVHEPTVLDRLNLGEGNCCPDVFWRHAWWNWMVYCRRTAPLFGQDGLICRRSGCFKSKTSFIRYLQNRKKHKVPTLKSFCSVGSFFFFFSEQNLRLGERVSRAGATAVATKPRRGGLLGHPTSPAAAGAWLFKRWPNPNDATGLESRWSWEIFWRLFFF